MKDIEKYGNRSDKVYGELIGVVETPPSADPLSLLRCQVRVLALHGAAVPVKDLPWAEFKLPIGCRVNDGSFLPPVKGDTVWVDYPYDFDPRRPRITGSAHYAPGKVPNLPHETFAGPKAYKHKRTGDEPKQAAHIAGEDTVFTQNGIMVAVNKDGSMNLVQKSTGTEITVTKTGDLILHVEGNLYRSATKGSRNNVMGDDKELIFGKKSVLALKGVDIDGGPGALDGVVTRKCKCAYTGNDHPVASITVKASL